MLLKLYQAGQPVLRTEAKAVSAQLLSSPKTQDLIDSMIVTLRDAPGVGLSASQVGEALQIIVVDDRAKYHEQVPPEVLTAQDRKPVALKVLVNPKLTILDPQPQLWFEGCLSIDGYVAAVARAKRVRIEALDRYGKALSYVAHGWQARILQHEVDHLQGVLLIDRMRHTSFISRQNFNNLWRKALQPEIERTFGRQ